MAIYRAKGTDTNDAKPREILVDAPDLKSARKAAQRANIWSPRLTEIMPGETYDASEVVVFDPDPPREPMSDMLRERPVWTIALGVFCGMTMYSLLMLVLGALFSN